MATGDIKIHRIKPFYGGIVSPERDRRIGVASNVEEFDIYTNADYMEPDVIFEDDSTIENGAWDFTHDGTSIFAIGTSGSNPKIWKRANAMSDGLASTSWAALYTDSGQTVNMDSPLEVLEWETGTKHLYFITGTGSLRKYGDILGSPSASAVGTLSGASNALGRFPSMIREGELLIGHGQYIAKVDDNGNFTDKAWTAPTGWRVTDFDIVADNVAVLCSPVSINAGQSAIFYWDGTATTGFIDFVYIPTGNPQMIVNHAESIRVFCISKTTSTSGTLRIYEMLGKKPYLSHQLDNVDTDYNTPTGAFNYTVSPKTKSIINNTLYFGVAKTDKSGIYSIGQAADDLPVALSLARRCNTTDYANHYPISTIAVNRDMLLAAYDANTSAWVHKKLVYSTASRSSTCAYESVWVDDNDPETHKRWDEVYVVTSPLPTSCTLTVSGRVDDTSASYTELASFSTTGNTYHKGKGNLNGKAIQLKITAISSGTSRVKIYSVGVRSVSEALKQASK